MKINEGDKVIFLYGKNKDRIAIVTGLHLKDVSVRFLDNDQLGSYRYSEVKKVT